MSGLDSWEDDPAAQEENLSQQTRNMNINGQQFRPGANSFQPGAASFQPGQQYGGYQQQQQYPQYGAYPQYGQQPGYQQYQGYNQSYGQNYQGQYAGYSQNAGGFQQQQQQQQPQQRAPISIAKRPSANDSSNNTSSIPAQPTSAPATSAPKAKVLSIGGDAPKPKVAAATENAPKILSIGVPPPAQDKTSEPSKTTETAASEEGSKVKASKAIEKTGEKTGKTSPSPSSGRSSPTPGEKKTTSRTADAVAQEQSADVDEATLEEIYGKEHVNLIFIGHVDAGKSTLGGAILYACGMVDERTMEKYKMEAKAAGRETWYLSWALDLTREERAKGHKNFVPNMIGGASQADIGILVISARKGEYETGFEKGGQTREHAVLAKTQGVNKLVIVVNKMDDPTVEWSKASRFYQHSLRMISAQTTTGIRDRVPKNLAPWNDTPSLLEYLDGMAALERKVNAPFMMPVGGKYKDMGTVIEGRIESGVIKKGMTYLMMPNRVEAQIAALYGETEDEIPGGVCGDQVRVRIRGVEEEEFNCVLHVHAAIEEVVFGALLHKLEKGTGRKSKKPPPFAQRGMSIIARLDVLGAAAVCVERFEDYPQMGRFTLRDQGQTIAIGKITKLITDAA
ncbi:MAG: hypothetical protein Q9227_004997 [Pyrenula ochraceoflavens]